MKKTGGGREREREREKFLKESEKTKKNARGEESERASVHMLVNTKLDIFIGIIREYLLAFEDVLPYPRAS